MKFVVRAIDPAGDEKEFVVDATDKMTASSQIVELGFAVLLVEAQTPAMEKLLRAFGFGRCVQCQRRSFGFGAVCGRCTKRAEAAGRQNRNALITECFDAMFNAFRVGRCTPEQIDAIAGSYCAKGLTDDGHVRKRVFETFVHQALSDGVVTHEEDKALRLAREALRLPASETRALDATIARTRMFNALAQGVLPTVSVSFALKRNEVAHFVFPGVQFLQERVVKKEYVGRSSGVSFRIARGVTYRVGASRGELITRTALVPICDGNLTLTNQRLVFAGTSAFSIPLVKVLSVTPYSDGCSVTKDSTAQSNRPFVFVYPDGEYLNAAMSACINAA